MAETTQYAFNLSEVTESLVKKQGIQSGLWDIAIEFGLTAGLMGPTPEVALPTALLQVSKILLVRHPDEQPLNPTTFDASKLVPKTTTKRTKK